MIPETLEGFDFLPVGERVPSVDRSRGRWRVR